MIKVGVAGVTGYVGIELIRILLNHPQIEITYVATKSHVGKSLKEVYPHLHTILDVKCSALNGVEMAKYCDVVFTALPSDATVDLVKPILDEGKKIIDLGAAFRLKNRKSYEQWYGCSAAPVDLLQKAIYAIPEIVSQEEINKSQLIANPGCYPTCIALGAFPALSSGMIETKGMIFDAKSGVSGAGRELALGSHFCEVAENFKAYAVAGSHRHTPEIEQILGEIAGCFVTAQFTPHLLPMVRGLLVTAYLPLKKEISVEEVWEVYSTVYKDKPFVRICPLGTLPQTANVRGSNYCDVGFQIDLRTKKLIVVSVIDNLVKGAAGQAVQNMNLMFNKFETMGLNLCPTYP